MKLKELEHHLKELTRDRDRAHGARSAAVEKLGNKFDCTSIKKGAKLLEELKEKRKLLKLKCEEALQQFEKEYGSKIGEE